MSTCIYDAFRSSDNDVSSVFARLTKLRREIIASRISAMTGVDVLAATSIETIRGVRDQVESIKTSKEGDRHFSITAVIYPTVVISGERVTAFQVFGDGVCGKSMPWKKLRWVTDFHYQNQSDMPDSVSEKDWHFRERVWNRIFKNDSVPSLAGMSVVLCSPTEVSMLLWKEADRIRSVEKGSPCMQIGK